MPRIVAVRDSGYAPCGWLVCKVDADGDYQPRGNATVLVQQDWDLPRLAVIWGYVPCVCGATDGTVDCPHKTVSVMIAEAWEYLEEHGETPIEDDTYFKR